MLKEAEMCILISQSLYTKPNFGNNSWWNMTAEVPLDRLLERVKEAISNQPPIESDKKGKNHIKCLHHFGYLSKLSKNTSIPEECFFCSRVVECIAP